MKGHRCLCDLAGHPSLCMDVRARKGENTWRSNTPPSTARPFSSSWLAELLAELRSMGKERKREGCLLNDVL